MNKISSNSTFFHKRIFPCLWFGFLALFLLFAVVLAFLQPQPVDATIMSFVVPLVMACFGFVLFRLLIFDLVDEVWDHGDYLVAKNPGTEVEIPLADIANVNYAYFKNPQRITLILRHPTALGNNITFSPTVRMFPYSMHSTAKDLIERVDAAQRRPT